MTARANGAFACPGGPRDFPGGRKGTFPGAAGSFPGARGISLDGRLPLGGAAAGRGSAFRPAGTTANGRGG